MASHKTRWPLTAAVAAIWVVVLVLAVLAWRVTPLHDAPDPTPTPTPEESTPSPEPSPTPTTPTTYTVTLDTSATPGATVTPATVTAELGQPVTSLPYAHADNLRFTGWLTDPADPATRVDNATLNLLPTSQDTVLYAQFEPKPEGIDYAAAGLPILMYHYFYDPEAGEVGENGNWMDIRLFRQQLAWLRDNNYYFPTWDEAIAYLRGDIVLPDKSIVLTSDDGAPSFYQLAIPAVMDAGAKITSFVVLIDFDPANLTLYDPTRIFFRSHSYDMHRLGDGGSARLLESSAADIEDDVAKGEAVLGLKDVYCYPFGSVTDTAEQALAASGVELALAIINEKAYPGMDMMNMPRLRMSDGISLDYFIEQVTPG